MYKIFIVEDDQKLQQLICEVLNKYNYEVVAAKDFKNIEEQFDSLNPDVVLLDINLPYYDGYYFCRIFRRKSKIPIIIVSAQSDESNQIMGMEMGADDYITKPFSTQVLISKINSVVRRCYGEYSARQSVVSISGLELDENCFKATYKQNSVELSKTEFRLLKKFVENTDKIISREELLEELWDDSSFVDDNTLTVNITRVKNKLSEIGINNIIKTKRGVGYLFDSTIIKEQ